MKFILLMWVMLLVVCPIFGQGEFYDVSISDSINGFVSQEWIGDVIYSNHLDQIIANGHFDIDSSSFTPKQSIVYRIDSEGVFEKQILSVDSTVFMAFQVIEIGTGFLHFGRFDESLPPYNADYFILETDFEGNMLDLDVYGEAGTAADNQNNEARSMSIYSAEDHTILSCGHRFTGQGTVADLVIWVNKIDLDTDSTLWELIIDRDGLGDYAFDIKYNEFDDTYIVSTERFQFGGPYQVTQYTEFFKIDTDGNIIEQSQPLDPVDNGTRDALELIIDDENNIVIVGNIDNNGALIRKFSPDFTLLWESSYNPYNNYAKFKHIRKSIDGHYLAGGNLNTDEATDSEVFMSGLLVKYHSETGDTIWTREFAHQYEGTDIQSWHNYVEGMTVMPSGCIVVGGYVFSPIDVSIPQAAWIRKFDMNGQELTPCMLPDGVEDHLSLANSPSIYPNPVLDEVYIKDYHLYDRYQIINVLGMIVQEGAVEELIKLETKSRGYFTLILDDGISVPFVRVE